MKKSRTLPKNAQPGDYAVPLETPPIEAKSAASLPEEMGAWQYEPKWDGFRCLAFKSGPQVDLRAKSGKPLGRYFPEIVTMLAELPANTFVLDGELVIEIEGHLAFDALQMRLHPAESRIQKLSKETPARLILFDVLADLNGAPVMDRPLSERRAILERFIKAHGIEKRLIISPATQDLAQAQTWLSQSGTGATDGVIAKRLDSPYLPGERLMTKVKQLRTADCVVGGFRYESDSQEVGSLLLGLMNTDGKLDHVGFTTLTDADRPALTKRLEALREAPGFTGKTPGGPSRWATERSTEWEPLKPELVVEVRFDHVTGDRFRHGTKLIRWRPDKSPQQCTFDQIQPPTANP